MILSNCQFLSSVSLRYDKRQKFDLRLSLISLIKCWICVVCCIPEMQFDPIFSPICCYSFIFGLLQISIGLSVLGFVANEYKWTAIRSLSTIRNIRSGIRWTNPKVKKHYSPLLSLLHHRNAVFKIALIPTDQQDRREINRKSCPESGNWKSR